jgi:Fe-S-cluster-containing hydrogenase component 2
MGTLEDIVRRTRRARRFGPFRCCVVCGTPALDVVYAVSFGSLTETVRQRVVQRHHLATRRLDPDLVVPVCPNCHEALDLAQYSWPERARRTKNAARLHGLADLLEMRARIDRQVSQVLREIAAEDTEPHDEG